MDIRACAKTTLQFRISFAGHLWLILSREILERALLLLRFRSLGSTKPDLQLSAKNANLFLRGPLGETKWRQLFLVIQVNLLP